MAFLKGHGAYRTKEQYAKADKSIFATKEYREKMRKIALKRGYGKWMKGMKRPKEVGEKIAKANTGRRKKDPKTPEWKRIRCSKSWLKWRKEVFERDDYTCQECGIRNKKGLGKTIELNPHHIKSVKNYPNLVFEVDNGITLCRSCHMKTESWGHHK